MRLDIVGDPIGHHFLERVLEEAQCWQEEAKVKCWNRSTQLLRGALERCKITLLSSHDADAKNAALLSGILIRGMQDAIQLFQLSSREGWSRDTSTIEKAWRKLCDAQDRLSYVSRFVSLSKLAWVIERLSAMDTQFTEGFGSGLYMSAEILVRKELCSVCQQDIKGCNHIPGDLYAGVRCFGMVEAMDLQSIAVVGNPKDRRCRIWPWHLRDGNRFRAVIDSSFRLDDFLDVPQ